MNEHQRYRLPARGGSLSAYAIASVAISTLGLSQVAPTPENAQPKSEQVLKLNPFEVREDSDSSYGALNSNSITRFNTPLNELPVSADIFTETFINDVGATSIEEVVMNFSAGGGYTTMDPASDAAAMQAGDRQATSGVTVRGLMSPTLRRDGFIQMGSLTNPGSTGSGFSSTFDVERIEVINGPQSLLYGSGGGGGVLNTISKQARFNKPAFGSLTFKISEFGHHDIQADYGMSKGRFAVRIALLNAKVGNYRKDIGGDLAGEYVQVAANFGNTVLRATAGQTKFNRLYNANLTLTALNTANDGRNGQFLKYLIATDQLEKSAVGNSGAGSMAGFLNWENADSFGGWHRQEQSQNEYLLVTGETKWTDRLATDLSVGFNHFKNQLQTGGGGFFAPNATANPLDTWASRANGSTLWKPTRTFSARFAGVLDHQLFRASSKSMFGIDYTDSIQPSLAYDLYRADENWNIIGHEASRQAMPFQYYSIANGPVSEPLHYPFSERVTVNGINYVRALVNPPDPSRVGPDNPLGVRLGVSTYQYSSLEALGIYYVNQSHWMESRLTSLVGVRYNDSKAKREWQSTVGTLNVESKELNFNFGLNYKLNPQIHPYIGASSSFNPPLEMGIGPDGIQVETSQALGYEVGVKVQSRDSRLSGSIALYYLDSKSENQRIPGAYIDMINPNGINGRNSAGSTWANINRRSEGVQMSLTYNPTRNWRMRLAAAFIDGTIGTSKTYKQFYNDQFHTNAAGQVTFGNGTLVHVPATPNSQQPVVAAGTAGAVPLTIAMMNNPQSVYYANPVPISGAIGPTTALATVLRYNDPANGLIRTERAGLPLSEMQISPGFVPPGEIATSLSGELTTGYSKYSLNFTNMYTFDQGLLKGFRVGGSVRMGDENRGFYYFPTSVQEGTRQMFLKPDVFNVDAVVGYTRPIGRYDWSIQVNVNNLFDRYETLIIPNAVTGFNGVRNATHSEIPRRFTFSTTVSF